MRQLLNVRGLIMLAGLFLSASPVYAIQHCHDYTSWVITGNDANGTPPNGLRDILIKDNYKIALTTTAATPGADGRLRPGDVVFFGDAHSGVVNSQSLIDHFLQNMQQAGRQYRPAELSSLSDFYLGWTMVKFADLSREVGPTFGDLRDNEPRTVFPYKNMKVEVWRKRQPGDAESSQRGVPMLGGTWKVTVTETNSNASYEYAWEVRRSQDSSTISWGIKQTLLQTNNPERKQLIGQSWDNSHFEFRDGVIEYNRGRGVYSFSQWAPCTFDENSFSCPEGTQSEFGRTRPIRIEGRRSAGEEKPPNTNAVTAPSVKILTVEGDAEVQRGGKSYTLTSGSSVSSGDRITTGMDSSVKVLLPDGSVVELKELTDLEVKSLWRSDDDRSSMWLKAGEVSTEVKMNQAPQSPFSIKTSVMTSGSVRAHHSSNFRVKTSTAPLTQRGTRFTVRHNEQAGVTTISVTAGAVGVTPVNPSLQEVILRANQQVEVTRDRISPITSITAEENSLRAGNVESGISNFTLRNNTTISPPAKILRYFGSTSEEACRSSCAGEQGCIAYTFVRPGGYQAGEPPMCYLMSSLGPVGEHSCCVSGFKGGDSASQPSTPTDTTGEPTIPEKNGSSPATTAEQYNKQGDEFLDKEEYDKALEAYTKAVQLKPIASAYNHIGAIYNYREDWKNAASALQESLRLNPNNAKALVDLALSYDFLNRDDEALALARRVIALKRDFYAPAAYFRMGSIYNERKDWKNAASALQESLRLDPNDAVALVELAFSYDFLNRDDEALALARRAIALKRDYAPAYFRMGSIYNEREDWKSAVSALQQSIQLDPNDADYLHELAASYHMLKRYGDALDLARRVIALRRDYDQAYFRIGAIYNDQDKHVQAIEQLRDAIRLNPEFAPAHFQLGYAYHKLDRLPDAIQEYRTVIRLDRNHAEAHHNLGVAFVEQGNRGGALEQHRSLQRLNKELAQQLHEAIEGMESQGVSAERPDQRDRTAQNEEMPSGPSQGELPNITGIWSVKWTDPYAYYTFKWVLRRDGAGWQISQTLIDTNHGYNRRLIGTTWDDTTLEKLASGQLGLRRTSSDANPGNPGYFVQTATCDFSEGSFSCRGTHKGTQITHWISIEGNKSERGTNPAPKN